MLKFLGVVLLLLIVVGAAGWFLGWIDIGAVQAGSNEQVTVRIDKGEIERDTGRVAKGIRDAIDRFGAGSDEVEQAIETRVDAADEIVAGTVASVDVGQRRFVVRQPSGDRTFELGTDAELFLVGDEITLADLRAGDEVQVALEGSAVDFVVVRRS